MNTENLFLKIKKKDIVTRGRGTMVFVILLVFHFFTWVMVTGLYTVKYSDTYMKDTHRNVMEMSALSI